MGELWGNEPQKITGLYSKMVTYMGGADLQKQFDQVADLMDADILVYIGKVKRGYDDQIIDDCRKRAKRKNILLILATYGGDPDAAYRIARCLQEAYKTVDSGGGRQIKRQGDFIVFIDSVCKSAGTLICLGANRIIMSGNGELGPIDIQLPTENEVRGSMSGLTPIQAVNFLDKKTGETYEYLVGSLLQMHSRISTKMAMDISVQLTAGMMAPLYAQIDPLKLADVDRSLRVAIEYGERLQNGNLREGSLNRLLAVYPSHGFVIDRKEAAEIFKIIETPSSELRVVGDLCRSFHEFLEKGEPVVWFASSPREEIQTAVKSVQEKVFSKGAEG